MLKTTNFSFYLQVELKKNFINPDGSFSSPFPDAEVYEISLSQLLMEPLNSHDKNLNALV